MTETEFLQENQDTQQLPENPAEAVFEAPSWEDIKAGKVAYKDLPPNIKSKVKQEAYEETPEEKKYLWDDYGYTPPETYNGVDRNGRPVEGYGLDGFEDLVKKGRIQRKTKIEQDVENLANIVKDQSKTILSQRESDIEKRISEAKENMDFESYEKYLREKEDVKFQKLQLDRKPAQQQVSQIDVSQQYSLDEQVAIKMFGQNNKQFVELMGRNKEMQDYFDQTAIELYKNNPNAAPEHILNSTKRLTENSFNLNKQQKPTMSRNIVRSSEEKTTLNAQPTRQLTYNSLNDRDKKWVNSEARSGKAIYAGKSLDDIANIVYGRLLKK